MYVCRLRIEGFRGIRFADLRLGAHNVLVGPNNVGKTSVIEALALLLGRDRLVRTLTEHDFFGSNPDESTRILILATVTGFEPDDANAHRDWFASDRAGVEKWMDPATGDVHPSRDRPSWKLAVQLGFAARFDVETLEVETFRFYVDDDSDVGDPFREDAGVRKVSGRTLQDIGFFLVPAARSWDRWISFTSELFRRVVATAGRVPAGAVRTERARLWNPPDRLENAEGLRGIVGNINTELEHLMSVAPRLQLRVTSTDSEGLLQAVVPHFEAAGLSLPSSRQGAGLTSLQSLLLLMQFGLARKEKEQCFVLAVEEPELHVPPPLQKRLVNRLNAVCTQTIMTTHAPVVAALFPPGDVVFLRNASGTLSGIRLHPAGASPSNHAQHLFYGWRDRLVSALMHECVIVPEGVSDAAWLDAIQTAIELRQEWTPTSGEPTRFGTFVGVAPTADSKVAETYGVCRNVHQRVSCLVDGDSAGLSYLAALTGLAEPPSLVIVWPDQWTIETVVAWIADADWEAAQSAVAGAGGPTLVDAQALNIYLMAHKTYSPAINTVAGAVAGVPDCRTRAERLLNGLADVARGAGDSQSQFQVWSERSTAVTTVWRLQP